MALSVLSGIAVSLTPLGSVNSTFSMRPASLVPACTQSMSESATPPSCISQPRI